MHGNTTSGSIVLDLLERGPVILELSRFLAEADKGHGRLVFVGGEAGVGKSWVVRRFAELIRGRMPMLIGSCAEMRSHAAPSILPIQILIANSK